MRETFRCGSPSLRPISVCETVYTVGKTLMLALCFRATLAPGEEPVLELVSER